MIQIDMPSSLQPVSAEDPPRSTALQGQDNENTGEEEIEKDENKVVPSEQNLEERYGPKRHITI